VRCRRNAAQRGLDITYNCIAPIAPALKAGPGVEAGPSVGGEGDGSSPSSDADFIPYHRHFLHSCTNVLSSAIPQNSPSVAGALERHINQDYSLLTKVQSIPARRAFRARARRPEPLGSSCFNLQRHGGRSAARGEVAMRAGWHRRHADPQDLDLSYRAQLARLAVRLFVPGLIARQREVPVEMMNAFTSAAQRPVRRRLHPDVPQSCCRTSYGSNLPLGVKAEAFFHLSANFNYR